MKKAGSRMSKRVALKSNISRRDFICSGALAAAALAVPSGSLALPLASPEASSETKPSVEEGLSIRLGLASYTFRNFTRAQLIGFMKQLNIFALNAKDVKDHLPMDSRQEAAALDDYAAQGIKLHAVGAINFSKNEDADIRAKFEYCKRARIGVI